MTKQEKIQEAYGEHWETVKSYIDENGNFSKVDLLISGLKYYELSSISFNHNDAKFRPKSLQGIENNNGWIKIESEDDLPKETTECWFKYCGELFMGYYNSDFKRFNTMNVLFNINEVTHYQTIVKPQPPLY